MALPGLSGALLPAALLALWAQPNGKLALGLLVVAGLLLVFTRPRSESTRPQAAAATSTAPAPAWGGPNIVERWRYAQPVSVGGATFDRAWRHIGIIATTGARKSTLLAMLADQLRVPVVIITGDHAPPLENWVQSVGGVVWKARGDISWYPWGGPLELAAQRVEYMFPSNGQDVGVHRSMFKQAARQAWLTADERGDVRTLAQVLAVLPSVAKGQSSQTMVENWTARLREMEQSLGDSLGADLDVVETLRAGTSVMFSLNAFQDTSNRARFAQIAILEALRAAETLGNIGVAIDEVGLIGGELFGDAVRTFRVRKVTGLFASQIAEDFPSEVRGNVAVWFLGQQSGGDKRSRQWSSDATFGLVPPEAFGEHALPHGRFYVVAGGRVQQASVPTWKPRKPRKSGPVRTGPMANEERDGTSVPRYRGVLALPPGRRVTVIEVPTVPAWLDTSDGRRVWERARFGDPDYPDCWLSTYGKNTSGRPKFSAIDPVDGRYKDGQVVYRWVWQVRNGLVPDGYVLGHYCQEHGAIGPNETCFNPEHLRPELESESTKERWARWRVERSRTRTT
ncbi:MAG: hypothetical protein V4529_17400 [Gemmatimonadota bacterium]